VLVAAGQIHQLLYQSEKPELDIPSIHFTYSLIEARLVNFSELVHAFPDLVEKLLTLRDRLDVGEMVSYIVRFNNYGMVAKIFILIVFSWATKNFLARLKELLKSLSRLFYSFDIIILFSFRNIST
jgi:hypothetical protein